MTDPKPVTPATDRKPCPFCGVNVPFVQDPSTKFIDHHWIEHPNNGCRIGRRMYLPEWNTRPVEDSIAKHAASKALYYAGFSKSDALRESLEAQVKRCHAIIQGLVSMTDPQQSIGTTVLDDANKEISGEFCRGACTSACDEEMFSLRSELESERIRREAAEESVSRCAERVKKLTDDLWAERRKGRGIH